jgi:hypothetical protein
MNQEALIEAASDLRWLLSRGYPKEASLTLVGNKFGLPKPLREVLKRGVLPPEVAESRKSKRVEPLALKGERVGLDGHNVLITLSSALKGEVVLLGDDGFIRDIAGVSSSFKVDENGERAIKLILDTLKELQVKEVLFLLDAPMSHSRELAKRLNEEFRNLGLKGYCEALINPEKILEEFDGIVCTADGHLIDRTKRVFDLAGYIILGRRLCPIINLKA